MKYLPKNTLAYFQAAPYKRKLNFSSLAAAGFGTQAKNFREAFCKDDDHYPVPLSEALEFYALNHGAALIEKTFTPNEVLPPWAESIMEAYRECVTAQAPRMLYYLLSISVREARHAKGITASIKSQIVKAAGLPTYDFIMALKGLEENGAVNLFMTSEELANIPIGNLMQGISTLFYKGSWGSSYGGPKWGAIADTALSFLKGQTNLEMLVDTGYTLAHNGGPIFNKGMFYSGAYNGPELQGLLDIQRSGQVPEYILYRDNPERMYPEFLPQDEVATNPTLRALMESLQTNLPGALGEKFSWKKVVAAGPFLKKKMEINAAEEKNHFAKAKPDKKEVSFTGPTGDNLLQNLPKPTTFSITPYQSVPIVEAERV